MSEASQHAIYVVCSRLFIPEVWNCCKLALSLSSSPSTALSPLLQCGALSMSKKLRMQFPNKCFFADFAFKTRLYGAQIADHLGGVSGRKGELGAAGVGLWNCGRIKGSSVCCLEGWTCPTTCNFTRNLTCKLVALLPATAPFTGTKHFTAPRIHLDQCLAYMAYGYYGSLKHFVALILKLKIKVATQIALCGLSRHRPIPEAPPTHISPLRSRITWRMSNVIKC